MPSTVSKIDTIIAAYPTLLFETSETFSWSPTRGVIAYIPDSAETTQRLLHEISHALLKHTAYSKDIELIAMERDAWGYARLKLAPLYDLVITSETIESNLNTYRDWMHARSTCPKCAATGLQTAKTAYTCVACRNTWEVNTAIGCQLRRYSKKTPH